MVKKTLTFQEGYHVYLMISSGIRHMHALGFMHRDLKPGNILCSQCDDPLRCKIKIADFGLAFRYSPERDNTLEVQTLWWRTPEVLLGDRRYTQKVDVWSVGLIYMELVGHPRSLIEGDSAWGQIIKIFKITGTPNNDT